MIKREGVAVVDFFLVVEVVEESYHRTSLPVANTFLAEEAELQEQVVVEDSNPHSTVEKDRIADSRLLVDSPRSWVAASWDWVDLEAEVVAVVNLYLSLQTDDAGLNCSNLQIQKII